MMRNQLLKSVFLKALVGVLAMLMCAPPGWAIAGVRRRAVRRTAIVVGSEEKSVAAHEQAAAQQQAAAQTAAAQASAAASQAAAASAAAASQAAATASHAVTQKTTQQQLEEVQSLFKQGLITESDYNAAKAKILTSLSK